MFIHNQLPEKNPLDDAGDNRQVDNRRALARHSVVVDLLELVPAGPSAWIMSAAMSQQDPATYPPDALRTLSGSIRSSKWVLLIASIIFGCSAASFLQRRQDRDPNQVYVFAICVMASAIVGQYVEATVDYIMMVHVSWAVCIAMLACAVGHRIDTAVKLRSSPELATKVGFP